tara:strand:- start:2811 stop:3755 length:945 start_codon:yes stop_codon:yes gene_type:complete
MVLPKQVQRDLDEIEAYEKSLATPVTGDTETTNPVAHQGEESVAPNTEVPTAPAVTEETWETKYLSLKGKFDAEVPNLYGQIKALSAQVYSMQQPQTTAPAETVDPVETRLVSDKDVEEYGQELIDVQRRVAREELAPLRTELKKRDDELAKLRDAVAKAEGSVGQMSFEQKLAVEIPDFSTLNTDPKWIAWLDESDPYTSEPRRVFAENVYGSGDIVKLKKIVDFFKENNALPQSQAKQRQERQAELERQITPTRTNSQAAIEPSNNNRIYTEAEMGHLFNRVRDMNVAKKYDEASKLETELSEAYMQGRVRG